MNLWAVVTGPFVGRTGALARDAPIGLAPRPRTSLGDSPAAVVRWARFGHQVNLRTWRCDVVEATVGQR